MNNKKTEIKDQYLNAKQRHTQKDLKIRGEKVRWLRYHRTEFEKYFWETSEDRIALSDWILMMYFKLQDIETRILLIEDYLKVVTRHLPRSD